MFLLQQVVNADRRALLLGTALASTLLLGTVFTPSPASAFTCAGDVGTGPAPISHLAINDFIICVNTEPRTNAAGNAIDLSTIGANHYIDLSSRGTLSATNAAGDAFGINTSTLGANSPITIENLGGINATASSAAYGIRSVANGAGSLGDIENSGDFAVTSTGGYASGIYGRTFGGSSPLSIVNSGDLAVTALVGGAYGIFGRTFNGHSPLSIVNSGDLAVTGLHYASGIWVDTRGNSPLSIINIGDFTVTGTGGYAFGIFGRTFDGHSPLSIENHGDFVVTSTGSVAYGVKAATYNGSSPLSIENSGNFAVTAASTAWGIEGQTFNGSSPLSIENSGNFAVTAASTAWGIEGQTFNGSSPLSIVNSGDFVVTSTGGVAWGVEGQTFNGKSPLTVDNSGNFTVTAASTAWGIEGQTFNGSSPLSIINSGDFVVTSAGGVAWGIEGQTFNGSSPLSIINSGDFVVASAGNSAFGIQGTTFDGFSPLSIANSGDVAATATRFSAYGVYGRTNGITPSPLSIVNSGAVAVSGVYNTVGILGETRGDGSPLSVVNSGNIATIGGGAGLEPLDGGIFADTFGLNSPLSVVNSGDIDARGALNEVFGIFARTNYFGSPVSIVNSGAVSVNAAGGTAYGISAGGFGSLVSVDNSGPITAKSAVYDVYGIRVRAFGDNGSVSIKNSADIAAMGGEFASGIDTSTGYGDHGPITVVNSGNITAIASVGAFGIFAGTDGAESPVTVVNSGTVRAIGGYFGQGISVRTFGLDSPILIKNSGSVFGNEFGILAESYTSTKIVNTGDIAASNFHAIGVYYASAMIYNAGHITGYVTFDADDTFVNQKGGVFETKLTSDFDAFGTGGSDLFRNEAGGTVLAASDPNAKEHSAFVNLERFENAGLITMQDGQTGDSFEISNTVRGRDLKFIGSGNSTLGVDAFLGGPGSTSDIFTINGDVSGSTAVSVHNTNAGPGVFNSTGIPVVYVNGNVKGDEFSLSQPIDAGLFNYDLFFKPTGSGIFELRSFLGAGAFVLPQLITAAQDMWHSGSDTWFDRSTDLRVLLNGGAARAEGAGAGDPNAKYADGAPQGPQSFTPAVWARGAGNWLDRDTSANVTAYGRDYRYNLNRDLETIDFQSGIDLGKRGLLSDNDILVFGALGGFIHSDLDYDAINRQFSFEGGQVGGYATYLRGGLFVDTLVNVHLLQVDTRTLGFPNSINATNVGVRTDSGYRFGSFGHGAFIEPLATISVDWADIDGFSQGGNKVSFDDDPNVRGRLGVRVGTSMQAWTGITMEPFVIGSLWGNLSGDNQATLVSTGTTFQLEDKLQDVWGEVSAGVNFFNPSANTSVFAKLDVTFGQDIDGVGGKAGMRVSW